MPTRAPLTVAERRAIITEIVADALLTILLEERGNELPPATERAVLSTVRGDENPAKRRRSA